MCDDQRPRWSGSLQQHSEGTAVVFVSAADGATLSIRPVHLPLWEGGGETGTDRQTEDREIETERPPERQPDRETERETETERTRQTDIESGKLSWTLL